jgi:hypothetical protein
MVWCSRMATVLRFLQVFALGTWVGGIIYLSFIVAPGAFATLGSRDLAGTLVGLVLSRLHVLGLIAGVVFLAAALARTPSFWTLAKPASLAVILMVLLTFTSQKWVTPRLAGLRAEMGSVDATPRSDSRRLEFDHLHKVSVRLEGAVLLFGLAALYFTVRQDPL